MATHHYLQTLLPLLSLLLVSAAASGRLTSLSTNNLADGQFKLQGDVTMLPVGGYLLTGLITGGGLVKNSVGRIVWSEPIQFYNGTHMLNFEATLRFGIYPYESQPAEGITFFIDPVGTDVPEGSAGGNLGVFSSEGSNSNTFAVEFDSHYNPGTIEPTMPHIGIDIGSPVSSNQTYLGSALISQEVTATISYEHATRLITVTVDTANQVFTVTYVRDLSTVINSLAQFGVSASTGEDVSFQYLRFFEFRKITYVPISSTQVA